jgi:hypothetical protein
MFGAETARELAADPAFGIAWPLAPQVMAERDRSYPDFDGSGSPRA